VVGRDAGRKNKRSLGLVRINAQCPQTCRQAFLGEAFLLGMLAFLFGPFSPLVFLFDLVP